MFGEGMKIEITNFIKKVNKKKGYMMILLSATHFLKRYLLKVWVIVIRSPQKKQIRKTLVMKNVSIDEETSLFEGSL